jgi:CRP/FNR family transcriptional regulator
MTIILPRSTEGIRSQPRIAAATALRDCDRCEIRPASVCSVLARYELRAFEALGQRATFRPRATIFSEGDPAEVVYNITSGAVRLYRLLRDGSRQVVGFGLPGDFLGMPLDARYGFSADAAEFTTACRFPRQGFSDFLDDNPHFMRRVYESTTRRLDMAHSQMVLLGRPNARAKVAAFLIDLRARWARIRAASVTVALPMGRQDIGDFLGLSIATVSRTLHRLADERLILIVPRGVRILDLPRLQWAAEV